MMPQENTPAVTWSQAQGLVGPIPGITVSIPARLVVGWKTLRPWETTGMTEIGRRVIAVLDLVPGINGMDVHRYDLYVAVADGWTPEAVGNEIVEAIRPLVEESP